MEERTSGLFVNIIALTVPVSRPGERVGQPELFPGAHSLGGPMGAHRA